MRWSRTLARNAEKACPGLDPGWEPVFGQDHAQNNNFQRDDDAKENHPARKGCGCRSRAWGWREHVAILARSFRLPQHDLCPGRARIPAARACRASIDGLRAMRIVSRAAGFLLGQGPCPSFYTGILAGP